MEDCVIPPSHEVNIKFMPLNIKYEYKLGADGVYHVYTSIGHMENNEARYQIPSLKDYFKDLGYFF